MYKVGNTKRETIQVANIKNAEHFFTNLCEILKKSGISEEQKKVMSDSRGEVSRNYARAGSFTIPMGTWNKKMSAVYDSDGSLPCDGTLGGRYITRVVD